MTSKMVYVMATCGPCRLGGWGTARFSTMTAVFSVCWVAAELLRVFSADQQFKLQRVCPGLRSV